MICRIALLMPPGSQRTWPRRDAQGLLGPVADPTEALMKLAFHQGFTVGVLSSHVEELQQGWMLLQEAPAPPRSTDLKQFPRSFPRITPDRLTEMIADHEAGMSAYELADKYGHNRGTIMKHLAMAGIRSRVATPTTEEIFHWRELRAEGLGFKTIARRVERNHKKIRKYTLGN